MPTSDDMQQSDIQSFRQALASSKNIIILSGAGLSAASGIPTYRGSGGASLWSQHDMTACATPQAFKDNPGKVWTFYHHRRALCLSAKPNDAHRALATLSLPSTLSRIAPSSSPPLHVTQNIDALSLRVLEPLPIEVKSPAEKQVLEMHGSIFVTRCVSCHHLQRTYVKSLSSSFQELKEGDLEHDIPIDKLPRCGGDAWGGSNRYGNCGGLLRPEVVWFGEVPPLTGEISRKMNWCDLLLVVGTSSTVYPAAGFASQVKARGGKVAVFNLERSEGDDEADFLFLGSCDVTLPDMLNVKADIANMWPQK